MCQARPIHWSKIQRSLFILVLFFFFKLKGKETILAFAGSSLPLPTAIPSFWLKAKGESWRGQDEARAVVWAGFKAKLQATVGRKLHRALCEQLCAEAVAPRLLARQEVAELQGRAPATGAPLLAPAPSPAHPCQ